MAVRFEAGSKTIDGSGAKTISLSDFGGDSPKLLKLLSTKSTSDGTYQTGALLSAGYGDATNEYSVQVGSADNVGTSEVVRSLQDNILTLFDPAGQQTISGNTIANPTVVTVTGHGYSNGDKVAISGSNSTPNIDGIHTISNVATNTFTVPVNVTVAGTAGTVIKITDQITITSFTADTVTLSVDIYGGTSYTVLFEVWGGSTFTFEVGTFNARTTPGIQTVTTAFQPVGVFTLSGTVHAGAAPQVHVNDRAAMISMGFMEDANSSQCVNMAFFSLDQQATMNTLSVAGSSANCHLMYYSKGGGWVQAGRAKYSSFNALDFRIEWMVAAIAAYPIIYVAVKGSNWEVVSKTAPTSTGIQNIVNTGAFTPSGAEFWYGLPSTASVASVGHGFAANDGGSKPYPEGAIVITDDDGADPSNAYRVTKIDKVHVQALVNATSDDSAADLHSWNADGCSVEFTTVGAAGRAYHCIMFGSGTVTPSTGTTGDPQNFRRQVVH